MSRLNVGDVIRLNEEWLIHAAFPKKKLLLVVPPDPRRDHWQTRHEYPKLPELERCSKAIDLIESARERLLNAYFVITHGNALQISGYADHRSVVGRVLANAKYNPEGIRYSREANSAGYAAATYTPGYQAKMCNQNGNITGESFIVFSTHSDCVKSINNRPLRFG